MAYGFIDEDNKNDLVTINNDKNAFKVHLWTQAALKFKAADEYTKVDIDSPNAKILSIMISRDELKLQNLYVIYQKNLGDPVSYIKVFKQPSRGAFVELTDSKLNNLQLHEQTQPFILDIDGDMRTDLVYVEPPINGGKPKIRVALGRSGDSTEYEAVDFSTFVYQNSEDADCLDDPHPDAIISQPHSSAYLDLNGDCLPDIFMNKQRTYTDPTDGKQYTENYFEIYVQKIDVTTNKQKYCLKHTNQHLTMDYKVEAGNEATVPLVQFVDMNRDAMPDMVYYHDKKIYVFYNKIWPK